MKYFPGFTKEAKRQMEYSVPDWEHPHVLHGWDPVHNPIRVGEVIVYPEQDQCPEVGLVVLHISQRGDVLLAARG